MWSAIPPDPQAAVSLDDLFTVCGQMRPAIGWQSPALDGLSRSELSL